MKPFVVDLPTLAIIISITSIIQVSVLYFQYKFNNEYKGIGIWTIGSVFLSLGIFTNFFRFDERMFKFVIVVSNVFYITGMALWWIGTNRFFDKVCRLKWLVLFWVIIVINSILTTAPNINFPLHRLNISIGIGVLILAMAWRFLTINNPKIRGIALPLGLLFLFNGIFSLLSCIPFFLPEHNIHFLSESGIQAITYVVIFISGILWIFGVVMLINQRLITEKNEMLKNQGILFNTSPDAILITRLADGRFVGANEGFTNLTEYTFDEVLEKTTLALDIWVNPENRKEFVKELEKSGMVQTLEYDFRKKNNSIMTGLISARVIDYQNEPHIISVIHDITNRKIADKKFRMLFELSPVGLSMVDNNTGKFLEVNQALLEMTGYTKDEFLQLSYWDITPEEYRELEQEQMKDITETGFFGPNEKEYIRKDGSRFQISISGVLVKDPAGNNINWGFIEDITERKKLQAELKIQATTDELTGLYNRRYFLHLARKEINRSIRNFHPVSVAIFDLDRLKFFNDSFGHNVGDLALTTFAKQCLSNLREIDIFARYGGDEFALLLPETAVEEAEIVLERIRKVIHQTAIEVEGKAFNITTSMGLATLEHRNDTLDEVLARADAALYQAKEKGKNCIVTKHDSDFTWPVHQ
jgi:diguanylate cyclase (GGDEF)-like protein/PAS domain S-box-containing protein